MDTANKTLTTYKSKINNMKTLKTSMLQKPEKRDMCDMVTCMYVYRKL